MYAALGGRYYQLGDMPSSVELLAGDRPPSTELGLRSEAGGNGVMPGFPADVSGEVSRATRWFNAGGAS